MMLRNSRTIRKSKQRARKIFPIIVMLCVFCVAVISGFLGMQWYLVKAETKSLPAKTVHALPQEKELRADLQKYLTESDIETQEVSFSGSDITITLIDGQTVLLSSEKGIKMQISSLQFILSRLTMEDRRFSQLDLRFDKPVIVFQK